MVGNGKEVDTVPPVAGIVTPRSGVTIRGNNVDVLWNCSDDNSIKRVDIRTDDGEWRTVHWGETWGLGHERIRLGNGEHSLEMRAIDIAGNEAATSRTFAVNSEALSFGGPYYGYPIIAAIIGSVAIVAIALPLLHRSRHRKTAPPSNES